LTNFENNKYNKYATICNQCLGTPFSMTVTTVQRLYMNCRLKNFKHTTTQEFKGKTCIWFWKVGSLTHDTQCFCKPKFNSNNTNEKCSNLKNKRSSRLSRLNSWNLLSESLNLLQILLQAKSFFWSIQIWTENLAHKERFCSKSTNSMKDSRHKKPACYCIFHYLNKINKINMPGSRQLHTVLLISKTFASRRHQQHCCASAKIQARNSNESDFAIWVWNQISFLEFHLLFSKTKWLADICSNCWQISATYFAQSLWPLCE